MKTIANSCSYGIFIEVDAEDKRCDVDVYGLEHFRTKVSKEERFGHFFHPIIVTMLTSGARLLLAMAEEWLTRHRSYYAFCDTDSLAVKPFHWRKLQQFFEPLNPFGNDEFLKLEKENYDENGKLRDLWCFAVSSKRYCLYVFNEQGDPQPVKWSSHGLGHLLHENDGDWEKRLWTSILLHAHGKISKEQLLSRYRSEYAIAKLALTKPCLLRRVKVVDERRSACHGPGPFSFVLVGSPTMFSPRGKPIIPMTSFVRPYDLAPYQPFTDARTGRPYKEHTEVYWKTLETTVGEYIDHPEGKFENGHKTGAMRRRHIIVTNTVHIGKESNELEKAEALGVSEDAYVEYKPPSKEEDIPAMELPSACEKRECIP